MALPDRFATDRLQAERLTEAHFPELLRMHLDVRVMTWLGGVRDEGQTRVYLDKNLRHWEDHGFGLWIVRARGGGEPVGRALVRTLPVDGIREVEVGYALYPAYWGRGLATEIARECVALGRDGLGVDSLVGVTHPENRGSQHVLEKVGMVFEREAMLETGACALYRVRWGPDDEVAGDGDPTRRALRTSSPRRQDVYTRPGAQPAADVLQHRPAEAEPGLRRGRWQIGERLDPAVEAAEEEIVLGREVGVEVGDVSDADSVVAPLLDQCQQRLFEPAPGRSSPSGKGSPFEGRRFGNPGFVAPARGQPTRREWPASGPPPSPGGRGP